MRVLPHRYTGLYVQEQLINYRFGPYELRCRTRELYKHGTKLKVRREPFRVLEALLERRGDVFTREELRDLLWPKETFVDFEHRLNAVISELRGVLSDTASDPRYIETLPKDCGGMCCRRETAWRTGLLRHLKGCFRPSRRKIET